MKRIVLLIRVSSDKQETESQRIELIDFCQNENYTLDDMYIIENKENATKNEELRGLTELKKVIDDYSIEAVYVWELSRLSRRREVLNQMYDIFINQKINLICKQENMRLFDHNGELNVMTLTMFDFMKNMVVQDTNLSFG
jgi:DNA invertase Pin-like site-specific DNA recombinase